MQSKCPSVQKSTWAEINETSVIDFERIIFLECSKCMGDDLTRIQSILDVRQKIWMCAIPSTKFCLLTNELLGFSVQWDIHVTRAGRNVRV